MLTSSLRKKVRAKSKPTFKGHKNAGPSIAKKEVRKHFVEKKESEKRRRKNLRDLGALGKRGVNLFENHAQINRKGGKVDSVAGKSKRVHRDHPE